MALNYIHENDQSQKETSTLNNKKTLRNILGKNLLTILSLSLLSACGNMPIDNQSNLNIFGGTKVKEGEWPTTVGVVSNSIIMCTGTIVHPRLIITAAHCIEKDQLGIYLGNGNGDGSVETTHQGIKQGVMEDKQKDVGWISFSEDIDIEPSKIIPILYKEDEIKTVLKPNAYSHIVGYGQYTDINTGKKGNGGIKYEADTSVNKIDPIVTDGKEIKIGGNDKVKGACFGDSGGPAYGKTDSGEIRVYGIVSGGETCGHGGFYGLMHKSVCEIEKQSGIDLDVGNYCDKS